MTTIPTLSAPAPAWCSADEWRLRLQLAATYRVFHLLGWTELIFSHISLRVPGPDTHFLINPFGLTYDEVTASNLVKIDLDGKAVAPTDYPINPAGFVIHGAIHAAVPDAHCVMHTHTTAGIAVSCMEEGLSYSNFYAAQLHDLVAYHDFEGITVHMDERERLLRSMGTRPLLILRNHGLLSSGSDLAQAFHLLWTLQRACEIQLATSAMQGKVIPVPAAICAKSSRDREQFENPDKGVADKVLAALIRQVDRLDPSYAR